MNPENQAKLNEILFPRTAGAFADLRNRRRRLAHYTSAEVAVSILRKREMWMRNAKTMNDYMELKHGLDCVREVLIATDVGQEFLRLVDHFETDPGTGKVRQRIHTLLENWHMTEFEDVQVACFSEHDETEDTLGRLSMWRAYGGSQGVAMVFHADPVERLVNAMGFYAGPILYGAKDQTKLHFEKVLERMSKERAFLDSQHHRWISDTLIQSVRHTVCTLKHPGFSEEIEWRVFPTVAPQPDLFRHSVEVIRGTPQLVLKLPLGGIPRTPNIGCALPHLLDRIIIGPTQHPKEMKIAFERVLSEEKLGSAKVVLSEIPLR